ncbi:MAG TPA: response regulator [Tepidisphaeraceae bacterium]|nr:response regulator [Tepidisphaeraceae bacterium]
MIGEQRHSTRVLIVEDEPRMRELLLRAVGSWGWEVSAARTGEEALRAMEAEARQIVLLDLNLPGMGGLDCLEQMRRQWAETQVVILTGFGDLEAARRAIHLDVVEFLTKPCHLGELEQAMDRARRRLEDREVEVAEMEVAPPTAGRGNRAQDAGGDGTRADSGDVGAKSGESDGDGGRSGDQPADVVLPAERVSEPGVSD